MDEKLHRWLAERRAMWRVRWTAAPKDWKEWAERVLGECPVELPEVAAVLASEMRYDRLSTRREAWGQVFTPPQVADALAACWSDDGGDVLDPACGAGSLLRAIGDRMDGTPASVLARLEGWDRDPIAAWLCRGELADWAVRRATGPIPGELRVRVRDALEIREVSGFSTVIGNPPYVEAKRMATAEPGLRERLRTRLPGLKGAFDLYLVFLHLGFQWATHRWLWLVPNKVMQGKYAQAFRREWGHRLHALVDLASLKPRPFPGTGVYPVVLDFRAEVDSVVYTRRVQFTEQLLSSPLRTVHRKYTSETWFTPDETWSLLQPLMELPRLGSVARLVSTVSFHRSGLRERFVHPFAPGDHPYLGGASYARKTEVGVFRVDWAGAGIRYDAELLAAEGNPLPPLASTFLRPKVVWCQHAVRMKAVADFEGRWVTKDVYPVGWPITPEWSLETLTAVMNSTVFTALYNTLYRGIVVGGETYHYLPAFLNRVPIPASIESVTMEAEAVRDLHQDWDPQVWARIDRAVAEAYGIGENARKRLEEVHLLPGVEHPGK